MKRLLIILVICLLSGCQFKVSKPILKEPPKVDMDLGIKRTAVFLLVMRGDNWGEKELAAEIEYVKYLLEQK